MTPSPTESNVLKQLRAFLLAVIPPLGPDGLPVEVVQGQPNRIPETKGTSFVIVTPIRFERLRTNVDIYADAKFTGSIAGTVMTITDVVAGFPGQISVGSTIFGVGVAGGTKVTALGTGTGGVGTYTVDPTQAVAGRTLSAGAERVEQGGKWTVQIDFHGNPKADISGDMAITVTTLFRDGYAVSQFANQSPNYGVVPLYADDPVQRPFRNAEQQVENRWVVEALLQANVVVGIPQQFADAVAVDLIDVDAVYPP